jgi:quercetin dioxygenase-like cupin family protein
VSILHRHKDCRGITLLRHGRINIELWYVPAGQNIEPHSHKNFSSSIFILLGKGLSCKIKEGVVKKTNEVRRLFSFSRDTVHWFESESKRIPTIFINVEKWNGEPTSACKDFVKYELPTA